MDKDFKDYMSECTQNEIVKMMNSSVTCKEVCVYILVLI